MENARGGAKQRVAGSHARGRVASVFRGGVFYSVILSAGKNDKPSPVGDRRYSQPLRVHEPDERRECGGAELKFARVHLVERVFGRVVDVEVALRVGGHFGDGHALHEERGDISAGGALAKFENTVRPEKRQPARGAPGGVALSAADREAVGLEAAVVGFDGEKMFFGGAFGGAG